MSNGPTRRRALPVLWRPCPTGVKAQSRAALIDINAFPGRIP
ncbi:hypothetical protein DVDV_3550 [Desulfovibrio sp. DV]|nr:hypothetical protein DVDV_3550 [Desulfovibrio sp. DV]